MPVIHINNSKISILDPITIASGQSLSGIIGPLESKSLSGLLFDGFSSANVTFETSINGTDFFPLIISSGVYTITDFSSINSGAIFLSLDPNIFYSSPYIKVRSGTPSSPVNQGALRTITPVIKSTY